MHGNSIERRNEMLKKNEFTLENFEQFIIGFMGIGLVLFELLLFLIGFILLL